MNQPALVGADDDEWVFFLAILGVTMAIPMKRQMINIEQLWFSQRRGGGGNAAGLALARREGCAAAKGLLWAGVFGAFSQFWTEGADLFADKFKFCFIGTWIEKIQRPCLRQNLD